MPCAAGGSGAWAFGTHGQWECASGMPIGALSNPLSTDLDLGGNAILNFAPFDQSLDVGGNAILDFDQLADQLFVQGSSLSASTTTTTAHTISGNQVVTLGSASSFAAGNNVACLHCGGAATVSAPGAFSTAQIDAYTTNPNATPDSLAGGRSCLVDSSNATCTTSYSGCVMAVGIDGSWSACNSTGTIGSAPARLSATQSLDWKWSAVSGAVSYLFLGCTGASCDPTSNSNNLWAVLPANANPEFMDFGNHFGTDATYGSTIPHSTATAGAHADLLTQISTLTGTSATLATAPGASLTGAKFYHDNSQYAQAQIAARVSNPGLGPIRWPFAANAQFDVCAPLSFFNAGNIDFGGTQTGTWGQIGTHLHFCGSAGTPVFDVNWAPGTSVHDFWITGDSTPGAIVDVDARQGSGFTNGVQRSKANHVYNITSSNLNPLESGVGVSIGLLSTGGENEFVKVEHTMTGGGYAGIVVAAGRQTDNTILDSNVIPTNTNFGIWNHAAGTILERDNDDEAAVAHYLDDYSKEWNIDGDYAEGGPTYWYYDATGGGLPSNVRISNSEIGATSGPNGYLMIAQSNVTLSNNDVWCNGSNNCLIGVNYRIGQRHLTSVSNTYHSQLADSCAANPYPCYASVPFNLPFTDSSGGNYAPVFDSIGDVTNTGSAEIQVGTVLNSGMPLAIGALAGKGAAQIVCVDNMGRLYAGSSGICPTPTATPTATNTPTATPTSTP
ncbi:MAG: hypothetical protein WA005_05000 [Candidatus Binataceae bacterium]